jgi:hypothetical protein
VKRGHHKGEKEGLDLKIGMFIKEILTLGLFGQISTIK